MLQLIEPWLNGFFHNRAWMVEIILIFSITLCLHFVSTYILSKAQTRIKKTRHFWDELILIALKPPLLVGLWVLCLSLITVIAEQRYQLFEGIAGLSNIAFLLLVFWFCLRVIRKVEAGYLAQSTKKNKEVDKTLIHASSQLLVAITTIIATLMIMQTLDIPISGLLAFGGIGGAGVAFAAKDLLANFFGGLVIYTDRPFKVGEWIRSPDREIQGIVEYIGWRATRIRTFDKRPLYVPNGTFLTVSVENPSRMSNRRIKTNIGLRYEDSGKMRAILTDIKAMLSSHPEIDTRQLLLVNFVQFGPSSLDFMVYTFTKTTNWARFQDIQEDVFLKILEIIDDHGAECAFPTTTLFAPNGLKPMCADS